VPGSITEFWLPLAPAVEQKQIVGRAHALFSLADVIEERVTAAAARTDRLSQAILTKAFRGELVPTEADLARAEGRDYEPADALRRRIRGEHAEPSTRPAQGKKAGNGADSLTKTPRGRARADSRR